MSIYDDRYENFLVIWGDTECLVFDELVEAGAKIVIFKSMSVPQIVLPKDSELMTKLKLQSDIITRKVHNTDEAGALCHLTKPHFDAHVEWNIFCKQMGDWG